MFSNEWLSSINNNPGDWKAGAWKTSTKLVDDVEFKVTAIFRFFIIFSIEHKKFKSLNQFNIFRLLWLYFLLRKS
jgi:hypothetical protein